MKDNTSSLTPAELRVYNFVCENDPISAKDAAEALGIAVGSFYPLYRRIRTKGVLIPPLYRNGSEWYVDYKLRKQGRDASSTGDQKIVPPTEDPSGLSAKLDRTNVLLGKAVDVLEQTLSKLVQRDV